MSAAKKKSHQKPKPKHPTGQPSQPVKQVGVPRGSGVLKGKVVEAGVFPPKKAGGQSHLHFHLSASNGGHYDVAVNILSQDNSEVLFLVDKAFVPSQAAQLLTLNEGFRRVSSAADDLGLDYTAQKLVKRKDMKLLPKGLAAGDGELHDDLSDLAQRASAAGAEVYAFGIGFGNPAANPFFHFKPDYGLHDVHMNQGNTLDSGHSRDNGRNHDGALLVYFPDDQHWEAVFVAFQSQTWDNDERGYPRTN